MGATPSHGFTMGYVSGPFRTKNRTPTGVTDPSYKIL